jgi:phage tail-like protein
MGQPTTSRDFDHQGAFRFSVDLEFAGVKAGAFTAVDGLSATVELIEYQGGTDTFARQIPGRPKVTPVVLKKGYVNTSVLWDWMKATMDGAMKFENVSIVLLDDSGQNELGRYNLIDTWPSRWQGWQLDAQSSNAMVEEFELQVREITRVG